MVRNLHLMYDEKIINRTIQYFEEALPNCNKYIILLRFGKSPQYVKTQAPFVIYTTYGSKDFWKAVGDVKVYTNIIYHYLGDELVDFTLKIPKTEHITWIVWGGDLCTELLQYKGLELYAYPEEVSVGRRERLFPFIYRMIRKKKLKEREMAIARIGNLCVEDCDSQLLAKYMPHLRFNRREFFYYPVEDMLASSLIGHESSGDNIFVGNSASYTNNHRKVFELLSQHELGNRKVIVPLSYGPSKDLVLKYGNKLLGRNFFPLTEFVSLDVYNKMMVGANMFIYGNYRQEAWGNIAVALYLGAVVVMDSQNLFMKQLVDTGFVVFPMEDLEHLLNYKLSTEEKNRNRNLINKLYSKPRMLKLIKASFGQV